MLWHLSSPAQFVLDALAQHVGCSHLAVHDINPVRRMPHAAQPGKRLVAVGMGRCRGELHHLGAHIHVLPVDARRLFAARNACAPGAGSLVAGDDDHVAVVARIECQVVQHAPARGHAAGRQDHHRPMASREGLRFVGGLHHGGAVREGIGLAGGQPVLARVMREQPGGAHGHGAVQKHRQRPRNAALFLEQVDRVQHGLRPAHGKHRHHGHTAALGQALQGGGQLLQDVFLRVLAVTVGGFDQHGVGLGWCFGRVHDQVVGPSQIAGEQDAPATDLQQQAGRAQDVPGRCEGGAPARNRLEGLVEGVGAELLHAVLRIQARIQRQCGRVLGELVAVEEGGVFFLQVSAVGQENGAQVPRAWRAMDGFGIAISRQQGQVAAVVQVRVGQHHGIDLVGRERQGLPVAQAQLLVALEQAAIHQHAVAVVAHQVFGAGDGARAAQKSDVDFHCESPCSPMPAIVAA